MSYGSKFIFTMLLVSSSSTLIASPESYIELHNLSAEPYSLYEYKSDSAAGCQAFFVDYKGGQVVIEYDDEIFGPYDIVTSNIDKNIQGKWYQHATSEIGEESKIIERDEQFKTTESVFLDHDKKTYHSSSKAEQKTSYKIHDGFLIYEGELDQSPYFTFVQAISDFAIQYVDCFGKKHVEQRYTDQKHLEVPADFKKTSE